MHPIPRTLGIACVLLAALIVWGIGAVDVGKGLVAGSATVIDIIPVGLFCVGGIVLAIGSLIPRPGP